MNGGTAAIYLGGVVIKWPSLIIALGLAAALTITLALYIPRNRSTAAVWAFFPIAFVISVLICRLSHWYFNMEQYSTGFGAGMLDTMINSLTDWSIGSYCLPGAVIGAVIAAGIVSRMGLVSDRGRMLDYAAPGMCIAIAFIRLSAHFNTSCRGKRPIEAKILQRLPFGIAVTDAAGNVTYRLAVFFIEFLLMTAAFFAVYRFFMKKRNSEMYEPCRSTGNTWKAFLVLYSAIEIVTDSLRTDSPLMHFSFLTSLNAYSAFISVAQVCSVVFLLWVFVYYLRCSASSLGFSWKHAAAIVIFVAALAGVGYFGEYSIQRYGSVTSGYIIMIVSLAVIAAEIFFLYRSCTAEEDEAD